MWKEVKGFEGFYEVSDQGEVRRILSGNRTKPLKARKGKYPTVSLSRPGVKRSMTIHRMVAEAFIEKPEWASEVNHIDGNTSNNVISNLEWVTQKQNLYHAMLVLDRAPYGKHPRRVRCKNIDTGEVVAEYPSVSEAARQVGTMYARAAITQACKHKYDTAYGYRWEYINN